MLKNRLLLVLSVLAISAMACSLFGGGAATEAPATEEPNTIVVTATNPPAPTEAPQEAMEEVGATATARQNSNVRSGPGTGYNITGFIGEGESAPVIGQNGDGTWLLISQDGESGWVSSSLMDTTDLTGVPVVNVPPPSSSGSGGSSPTSAAPTATSSGGGGGGGQPAPTDSHISTEVNIKDDTQTHSGVISYPDGDNLDQVHVRVVGFDSVTTSGNITYTLTCNGEGLANVQVHNGQCNDTWTEFYTDDSYQETIRVYLESGGSAYINWTLIISANN